MGGRPARTARPATAPGGATPAARAERGRARGGGVARLDLPTAATLPATAVLERLGSTTDGLGEVEAARRLEEYGPNAMGGRRAGPFEVLGRQLRNPLLILLGAAVILSAATGDAANAAIVSSIVVLSVGLGFFNEFRSEQAVAELHARVRHRATLVREGRPAVVDVGDLVPGDVVALRVGDIVPADLRLLDVVELECDEAVLTGESVPAEKQEEPVDAGRTVGELASCALLGTVVSQGSARGVVVATGADTEFGRVAAGLGQRQAETAFQVGLARFSKLLVRVAGVLTVGIFVINVALQRPFVDALLFSLAIAIGLTPQLLPAIVTVSLSTGSRRLATRRVLIKRLVSIEDLGNVTTLFTDKTGTLTEGSITFDRAVPAAGSSQAAVLELGLVCNEAIRAGGRTVSGNQLDTALWTASGSVSDVPAGWQRLAVAPFDHERRAASVVARAPDGSYMVVVKGEPERILEECPSTPADARSTLDALFDTGARVIAVATRPADPTTAPGPAVECDLQLAGFLTFVDRPKADAPDALVRLRRLGVEVKVITGDSERVARNVCGHLGLDTVTLTGAQIEAMTDEELIAAIGTTTVFARTGPDQKARIVQLARRAGEDVGFMGDGVNDAVALHHADVGISVDTASEVAKDAADIVLLDKDLDVLADGIHEGRRIFANTMKYVLMATSSNFGNMFSAAAASLFLPFLPLLPSQILLNNLLYDAGQMTIPTDRVDEELLARPASWDVALIRRFMSFFGPISSLFDFATFGILLGVLGAGRVEFRSGWFVESLATQSLVIFVIRTRRVPFWRSRPSTPLLVATVATAATGAILPFTPLAHLLGLTPLPATFMALLFVIVLGYLAMAELGTHWFFATIARREPGRALGARHHRTRALHRRHWRFRHRPA